MGLKQSLTIVANGTVYPDAYWIIEHITILLRSRTVEVYANIYKDKASQVAGLDPIKPFPFNIDGPQWDTLLALQNGTIPVMRVLRNALYAALKNRAELTGAQEIDND